MNIRLPRSDGPFPVILPDGTPHRGTVFLSRVIDHPAFQVGDFTYASDFDPPEDGSSQGWATRLAPYLFAFSVEKLRIGRFCQIAHGVRFITGSASHRTDGLSCYPFEAFQPTGPQGTQPDTRDTVVGHDVCFGQGAMILPGAQIGNGVIIGAGAVVRGTVPDYAIVTGNPGSVTKYRFAPDVVARLLDLAWWDWPFEAIEAALPAIVAGDVDRLATLAPS